MYKNYCIKILLNLFIQTNAFIQELRSTAATEELVQTELANQRRDLELEYQRRMSALRTEMENEMRSQLRRQAAAHADHIQDVVDVQQTELGRLHARVLDEAVTSEKSVHKQVK